MDGGNSLTIAQFIAGMTWPVILCLVIGVVLLVIEMFTPGFGVPGFLGIVLLLAAIVLRADSFMVGLWMTVLVMAIVGVMLLIFLRSAAKGAISRSPIVLNDELTSEEGFLSTEDLDFYLGQVGKTLTILRPAGVADFDGVRLDVVSDGGFIDPGAYVRVSEVEGRRIVVQRATEQDWLQQEQEQEESAEL